MDIKDSYLHGTVGVVKSISVSADKLTYNLADVNNTAKTVTLPLATQSANGLLSKEDKTKLDQTTGLNQAIPYIVGPSTDTTAGTWTGSYAGITAYTEGLTIIYVPAVAGASTTTLNINELGAKTCYYTGTSKLTTHYAVGTPILLTYSGGGWKRADYYLNTYASAFCNTAAATSAKTASCYNYTLKANSYIHVLIQYSNTIAGAITMNINNTGAKPIYINGSASSASNYTLPAGTYIAFYDGTNFYFRTDGILPGTIENATNATSASKVANNLVIKLKSGTTEGTDLYTYNGSAEKTLDIQQGSNITLTTSANTLSIAASDTKVTQTNTTANASYRVLFSGNPNDTTETATARKSAKLIFNPHTETLKTTLFSGNVYGTLYTERGVLPSTAGNIGSGKLGWFTVLNSSGYAGDNTGFPTVNNANGILWLGTHLNDIDSTKVGYGHQLGFSSNGKVYHRSISNGSFPTTANGGSWKQIAYTTSNITGNAATADKLKNSIKLWGQDFDGSADVSGSLTGVTSINMDGDIIINDGNNHDRYIKWQYNNTDDYGWRIGYLGSKSNDDNDLTIDSYRKKEGWASALYFKHTTLNAHFAGTVVAPTFQGNLDGSYINKLTNYTKATAVGSIADTDSLNTALGKLEFKTDFIYNDLFGTDNDEVINKWSEIVDFIDSVKEGTDITDEFVTRQTEQEVTGNKKFINIDGTYFRYGNNGVRLIGQGEYGYLQLGQFAGDDTRTHKGKITGINAQTLTSLDIKSNVSTFYGTVTATKFITSGGTSSQFVKGDGSVDSNTYATTGSLDNYIQIGTSGANTAYKRNFNINGTAYDVFRNSNSDLPTVYVHTSKGNNQLSYSNGSNSLKYTTIQYLSFALEDNGGRDIYLLIADLTNWKVDTSCDIALIGTIYGHRGDNQSLTGSYNITAQCTSYAGGSRQVLYTDTYTVRTVQPYIVDYNGTRYLALKKRGSGDTIYFIGYAKGLLSSYITINASSGNALPSGLTIVHSPSTTFSKIATTMLFDGTSERTILHSGNYTDYTVKKDGTGASGTWNIDITGSAAKLTTVSKKAWGQTYWTSEGVPTNISGDIYNAGNIWIPARETDKYITFTSSSTNSDGMHSWRIGYLGSGEGDGNHFILQSTKNTTNTWSNAMVITNWDLCTTFGGNVCPLVNNTKTLGTSSLKWNNVYATTFTGNLTGTASKVTVGLSANDYYRAIVVHTAGNALYSAGTGSGKPQYNYYTGDVKAKSFTTDGGNFNGNATTATTLKTTTIVSDEEFILSNASWTDTDYTFTSLASGTYAIQVTCENLVASGIMSVYKNIDDTAGDEIPLHVYHDSTQPWRPYLRTSGKKLQISSNDVTAQPRKVTIKIAQIL